MIIKEIKKKIASTKALSKIECQLRYLMQNMSSYIFYSLQTVSYTISIILKKGGFTISHNGKIPPT